MGSIFGVITKQIFQDDSLVDTGNNESVHIMDIAEAKANQILHFSYTLW
jgi:hypothetical protein